MRTPKILPLDAAAIVLGAGLVLGLVAKALEFSRPLAGILGF